MLYIASLIDMIIAQDSFPLHNCQQKRWTVVNYPDSRHEFITFCIPFNFIMLRAEWMGWEQCDIFGFHCSALPPRKWVPQIMTWAHTETMLCDERATRAIKNLIGHSKVGSSAIAISHLPFGHFHSHPFTCLFMAALFICRKTLLLAIQSMQLARVSLVSSASFNWRCRCSRRCNCSIQNKHNLICNSCLLFINWTGCEQCQTVISRYQYQFIVYPAAIELMDSLCMIFVRCKQHHV